jgi:hypothetical protein
MKIMPDGSVLSYLANMWIKYIRILDSAPLEIVLGSYFDWVSKTANEISNFFVKISKLISPSLKELSKQIGIYGLIQTIIYRLWTHRMHPSLRSSRANAGFLGGLFT